MPVVYYGVMEKTLNETEILDLLAQADGMLESNSDYAWDDASWEEAAQNVVDQLTDIDEEPMLGWRWSDWGGIEFFYGEAI